MCARVALPTLPRKPCAEAAVRASLAGARVRPRQGCLCVAWHEPTSAAPLDLARAAAMHPRLEL